jgi:hypothetical protein
LFFALKAVRAYFAVTLALLAGCASAYAHVIPNEITAQAFVRPGANRLHVLVRVPFDALADFIPPLEADGRLDLKASRPMLADAAKTWISEWIDLYEDNALLPKPIIARTIISLATDNSFASYDEAMAHLTGGAIHAGVAIYPDQASLDVLLDYPIRSQSSRFAIHSRLARLAGTVITQLQFVAPGGSPVRSFIYEGDPGTFALDPGWFTTIRRFAISGAVQVIAGSDYLLFLFCMALLFRRTSSGTGFVAAFVGASLISLCVSAEGWVPNALWFPVLFETLIAISIVYVALESIFRDRISKEEPWREQRTVGATLGLIYGCGFSFLLRQSLQFSGGHRLLAITSFGVGTTAGVLGVLGLFALMLHFLFRTRVPEYIGIVFLAALATHVAWHRTLDRAQWLSSTRSSWPLPAAGLALNLNQWTVVALVLASLIGIGYGIRWVFIRERDSSVPIS